MSRRASLVWNPPCACAHHCGDVAEADDNPEAVCKGLPAPLHPPPAEIVRKPPTGVPE